MALVALTPFVETLSSLRTAVPKAIGEIFTAMVMLGAQQKDILSQFEGNEGSNAPIVLKNELKGGRADTVNFPTSGELGGKGRIGDEALEGYEVNPITGNFNLQLDAHSQATGFTWLNKAMRVDGASRETTLAKRIKHWWGTKKQNDGLMALRNKATSLNTFRPDGKSRDQLTSNDVVSTAFLDDAKGFASSLGVAAMEVVVDSTKSEIWGNLVLGPNDGLRSLNGDTAYRNTAFYGQERGDKNTLIRGGLKKWNGDNFFHFDTPMELHDGCIQTPLNPKVRIVDASVTSDGAAGAGSTHLRLTGTAAITLYGGYRTQAILGDQASLYDPFAHMPGYDYPFLSFQDATPDSASRYGWLVDTSNKRIAFVRYVGSTNNGQRIQITKWTSATASADTVTAFRYIAGVNAIDDGTGLDSTATTGYTFGTEFTLGSTFLVPANKWGTALLWTLYLGKGSLLRAYGIEPMHMLDNERDYKRRKGIGVEGIYGQNTPKDAANRTTSYLLLEHAGDLPGIDLPDVTGLG